MVNSALRGSCEGVCELSGRETVAWKERDDKKSMHFEQPRLICTVATLVLRGHCNTHQSLYAL